MKIEQKVENFIQRLPWRRRNQEILIDLVDSCPGACPTCPVGVDPRRNGHHMSIDTFRRILDKAQSECNVWKIQLYRWSDPLMHPDIHLFAEECYRRGIPSSTSSFLQSTTCDWYKLAASRVTEFRVSFSGWKNMHIYQKPATAERFLKKFEMLSKLPWAEETAKVFFFHEYKDNRDEIAPARELAESHGFKFVTFPATFMVYDRIIEGYNDEDRKTIAMLTETPEENIARHRRKPDANDWCGMQEREIVLDSYGNMQLCQMMFRKQFKIGNFLTTPLDKLRAQTMKHSMCPKCKAKGVGHYSLIFSDPAKDEDTVATANEGKYARRNE
jgi:sulfatase maturation enzyme AslB (radical SAM superfamily)